VAGFVGPGLFYRSLRRQAVGLALAMAPALLRNPGLLRRALGDFRRAGEAGAAEDTGLAELSSLAVDPAFEGCGIGRALVNEFVTAATGKGAGAIRLTTDAEGNDAVNGFYRRVGFVVERTFESTPGRLLNELRLEVRRSGTGCARTS
jgi:ribosomal protein S18 acetylase RimI-like enzyme